MRPTVIETLRHQSGMARPLACGRMRALGGRRLRRRNRDAEWLRGSAGSSPNDEVEIEDPATRWHLRKPHTLHQHGERRSAQLILRLCDRRQRRAGELSQSYIVEPSHGEVVRDLQTQFRCRAQDANGHHVIACEYGRGRIGHSQEFARPVVAPLALPIAFDDKLTIDGDTRLGQSFLKPRTLP